MSDNTRWNKPPNKSRQDFIDRQYGDFRIMRGRLPFASDGKAVFYSGGEGANLTRAENFARKHGMKPITETKGGRFLNQIDTLRTFEKDRDKVLWSGASRRYASQMKGEVRTFVCGSQKISTFRRVEISALLKNKNVTKINGIDRAKLNQIRHEAFNRLRSEGMSRKEAAVNSKDRVHRKIAFAELKQDLSQARKQGDRVKEADVKARLNDLTAQHKLEQKQIRDKIQTQAQVRQQKKAEAQKTVHVQKQFDRAAVQDRQKLIQNRAADTYKAKGMSDAQAQAAAQARAQIVKERLVIAQDRRDAMLAANKAQIAKNIERQQAFRDQRIDQLKNNAATLNKQYKGPEKMPDSFKQVDRAIKEREMLAKARLEQNIKAEQATQKQVAERRDAQAKLLADMRARDVSSYFNTPQKPVQVPVIQPSAQQAAATAAAAQAAAQSAQAAAYAAQASYDARMSSLTATARSYGYSFTPAPASYSHSMSHSHRH